MLHSYARKWLNEKVEKMFELKLDLQYWIDAYGL